MLSPQGDISTESSTSLLTKKQLTKILDECKSAKKKLGISFLCTSDTNIGSYQMKCVNVIILTHINKR